MSVKLIKADCGKVPLEPNTFDACLTDPPYGLEFMGSDWDKVVPSAAVWKHLSAALKPGAHLLAFGGTRTFDLLATALRNADFEIRDTLCWLYGQGFPKSLNVGKAIDKAKGAKRKVIGSKRLTGNAALSTKDKRGTYATNTDSIGLAAKNVPITAPATALAKLWEGYGTALKPAWEPIILARKPLDGTVAETAESWGTGALDIDGCRVQRASDDTATGWWVSGSKASQNRAMSGANYARDPKASEGEQLGGRWPANLILDEQAGALLDQQTGNRKSTLTGRADPAQSHANPSTVETLGWLETRHNTHNSNVYADSGGASRFFYCPKSTRAERDKNLGTDRNDHSTVKPIALTTYLARLILPPHPDAHLLVPFCGSGSEIIGALEAGWKNITGIEIDPHFIKLARRRIGT